MGTIFVLNYDDIIEFSIFQYRRRTCCGLILDIYKQENILISKAYMKMTFSLRHPLFFFYISCQKHLCIWSLLKMKLQNIFSSLACFVWFIHSVLKCCQATLD